MPMYLHPHEGKKQREKLGVKAISLEFLTHALTEVGFR
jgi:hypothetical protein